MSDRDGGSAFMAFILGGLTGAALALLYAPRSGRETREMLNEKMRDADSRVNPQSGKRTLSPPRAA